MSKHLKVYSTFKISVDAGIKGNTRSIFKFENLGQEVAPLIQYLMETLSKLSYPLVRSSIFSLVNIYCPDSKYSVGYQQQPHSENVLPYSGLVLTFSLVNRPSVKVPKEIYPVGASDYSIFWGKDYLSTTDYLTLCIPKNVLGDWKLQYTMQPDLLYLYNVLGMVTKAYVQDSTFLLRDGYLHSRVQSRQILSAQYNHVTLQRLMLTRSFNHWIYSKELWTRASNLIHPYHFYNEFGEYFAFEIFDWIRNVELVGAANDYVYGKSPNGFCAYIEKGLRDLKRYMRKEDVFSSEMQSAIYLLMVLGGDPRSFTIDDLLPLRQFEKVPDCLSDVHLAARSLVLQQDNLMQIAESIT